MTRPRSRPLLRRLVAALVLQSALLAAMAWPAGAKGGFVWEDVKPKFWAKGAITFVAHNHPWMTDYGATHFRPNTVETRKYLAHAMVLAFAPDEQPDRSIKFKDLAQSDPFYPYASVAVKRSWLGSTDGNFSPDGPVTTALLHRALVRALDLQSVAVDINHIHTTDGYRFKHPEEFGSMMLGLLLGLRYNHDDESLDVQPDTTLRRSEVAWSLYRAYVVKTQETWRPDALRSEYGNLHLGPISEDVRKVVEFGLRYVGYPYVYAGEWYRPTPDGYCCGEQPQGGFDCSGLVWWTVKAPSGTYDNTSIRPYQGWNLPQRSSHDMASVGRKLTYKQARAGDLMFYDGDNDEVIDHVDLYLGFGWALDSSSSIGGVTIMRVSDGWYRDHFVHARRIIK